MMGLTLLASFMNYASGFVFSRILSSASYGDLTALTTFAVVAAVPTVAAQTMIAERIAVMLADRAHSEARYLIRYALGHISAIALVVGALYAACVPLMQPAFHLQTIGPVIALAPLLLLSLFLPVALGALQGMERFAALGVLMLVVAASRVVIGVPWTLAGGGAGGPLIGQAFGCGIALVASAYLLRKHLLRGGSGAARAGLRQRPNRRTLTASGAFVGYALISNADVLLAKLLLAAHAAGEYAALVTVERGVASLPAAVAVVMVPSAATAKHVEGSAARVLRVASLLVVATTLLVALPAALAPRRALELMFGSQYVHAAAGVLPIVCAGTALALLYLVVVYTVAIRDHRSVWLLAAGIGLQTTAIVAWHGSPAQIATVQACVIGIVLVANESLLHPLIRAERLLVSVLRLREAIRS